MTIVVAIFAWLVGVFLIIAGLGTILMSQYFLGLLLVAFGLLIIPPIKNRILPDFDTIKTTASLFVASILSVGIFAETPEKPETAQNVAEQPAAQQTTPEAEQTAQTAATEPTAELAQTVDANIDTGLIAVAAPTAQAATFIPPSGVTYDQTCKVVGVSDGDTVTCLTADKTQLKIRLNQIDAPETGQDFGTASKNYLSDRIFGKQVHLDVSGTDRYNRTLAEIYNEYGENINKAMVAAGMAWAYREYLTDQEYIALEDRAKAQKIGLWSHPNPIYPSDYRRSRRSGGSNQASGGAATQSNPLRETQNPTAAPSIAEQIQQQTNQVNPNDPSCGAKQYCKEMRSCQEAKHYLNVCGLTRLDRDGDGVPCESLCRR